MPLILLLLLLVFAPGSVQAEDPAPPQPVTGSDVLSYLTRAIAWNRSVTAAGQLAENPREVVLSDKLRRNAGLILQKSFVFARAQAAIIGSGPAAAKGTDANTRRGKLQKAIADADKHIADLQSQLNRQVTDAQREKLTGALKLAQARQSLLQTMVGISVSEDAASGSLPDQVNALSRTVPDESPAQAHAPEETPEAKPPQRNNGIFALSDSLLSLSRKKETIESLLKWTQKLADATHALMLSTRDGLHAALAQGDALAAGNDGEAALASYRQSVDTLVDHYKQLSAAIIPLGEIRLLLEDQQQSLQQWDQQLGDSWSRQFHQLMLRISVLAISIAIPLILSMLAHRAVGRYVGEIRRRKQLEMTRRILLILALVLVILANFITEFGSLATFAGFMTAGLAVALQTVLISLVAHSLYFGRYGVHPGDKIKVADVTGEVLQLGMLRLYMRELKETDSGMTPTGRIVAFPNSILFQPAAFYKYDDHE